MNILVKIIRDDDGEYVELPVWHLVDPGCDLGSAALCTGEFFGGGESAVEFETKQVRRGGITCPDCLRKLRAYKAVKL